MKTLLQGLCSGLRVDELPCNRFVVYPGSHERSDKLARAICDTGKVSAGKEGHEYLRQLGLVQHVFAFCLGDIHVRVVSPGRPPAGQFSNLRGLEREITADLVAA